MIEMLVALTLTAFILTLTLGGFRFGLRVWESSADAGQRVYTMQALQRVMGDMLYRAFPLSEQTGEDSEVLFEGTRDRVFFAASLPPYPTSGGLHLVTLQVVADRGRSRLHLARVPYATGSARIRDDPEFTEVIFEGAERISFSYRDPPGTGTGGWEDSWDGGISLPALIRVDFTDQETSKPSWPSLVFPVAITAEAACLVPDVTGPCRWRED